jgi:hypothetical protein
MNSEIPPSTRNAPTAIAIALEPLRLLPLEVVVVRTDWVCVLGAVGVAVCEKGTNGFGGPPWASAVGASRQESASRQLSRPSDRERVARTR